MLCSIDSSDTAHYYHQDALQSVTVITDGFANKSAVYEYDIYGKIKNKTGSFKNEITYTGRWLDEDTGLHYYRARWYDANSGRFISRDPIGVAGGINLYGYVGSVGKPLVYFQPVNETNLYLYTGNNPINRTDPLGLWYIDINLSWISPSVFGGWTSGVMINNIGIYKYTGGTSGIPGPGASISGSLGDVTPGYSMALQGGYIVGAQGGIDEKANLFGEIGLFTPGASYSWFYVEEPWRWPWIKEKTVDRNKCDK